MIFYDIWGKWYINYTSHGHSCGIYRELIFAESKTLKQVGVTSQREIEHVVMKAVESGKMSGTETFEIKMTLEAPSIGLRELEINRRTR